MKVGHLVNIKSELTIHAEFCVINGWEIVFSLYPSQERYNILSAPHSRIKTCKNKIHKSEKVGYRCKPVKQSIILIEHTRGQREGNLLRCDGKVFMSS